MVTRSDDPVHTALQLTGERTLPGIWHETYWFERHVVAYRLAATRVRAARPRVVVDAGCGEGYGLGMLATAGAQQVVGVDRDVAVTAHVAATHGTGDHAIRAVAGDVTALPLADDVADLTVSFQVVEHVADVVSCLRSLTRVTRPGGEVLIATPNRLTFTPGGGTPVNPFHERELSPAELRAELEAAGLTVEQLLGVRHGSRLRAVEVAARRSLPGLLATTPPTDWPAWLRTVVPRIDSSWFRIGAGTVDTSLDLLAVCRVPADPGA